MENYLAGLGNILLGRDNMIKYEIYGDRGEFVAYNDEKLCDELCQEVVNIVMMQDQNTAYMILLMAARYLEKDSNSELTVKGLGRRVIREIKTVCIGKNLTASCPYTQQFLF